MTIYSKEISKICRSITDLITQIETDQADLQEAQDNYENELQDYDPEDESAVEPEDPGYESTIIELDNLLGELSSAENILANF